MITTRNCRLYEARSFDYISYCSSEQKKLQQAQNTTYLEGDIVFDADNIYKNNLYLYTER